MTASQLVASAITWVAAIAAVIASALSGRAQQQARNALLAIRAERRTFPWRSGEVTITAPMSNADYEEIKSRWRETYGKPGTAYPVVDLNGPGPARPIRSQQDIDEQIAFTDAVCDGIDRAKAEEESGA